MSNPLDGKLPGDRVIQVLAQSSDYGHHLDIAILADVLGDSSQRCIFKGDHFEPYDFAKDGNQFTVRLGHPILQRQVCQQLADLLFSMGYKPTEMKPLESELKRADQHLQDAQVVRDRLLTLVEKES